MINGANVLYNKSKLKGLTIVKIKLSTNKIGFIKKKKYPHVLSPSYTLTT